MKGQAATEFIVILSVTLILVGIVAAIITDTGSQNTEQKANKLILASGDVGVTGFALTEKGITLKVVNNLNTPVIINQIVAGQTNLSSVDLPFVLLPNEEREFDSYVIIGDNAQDYNYALYISYTKNGIVYTREDNGKTPRVLGVVKPIESYEISEQESMMQKAFLLLHGNNDEFFGETNGYYVDSIHRQYFNCTGASFCPTHNSSLGMNGAIRFDGNDYLNYSTQIALQNSTDFSISIWVQYNSVAGTNGLFTTRAGSGSSGKGISLATLGSTNYALMHSNGMIGSDELYDKNITTQNWTHLAYRKNSTYYALYVDGQIIGSGDFSFIDPFPFSGNLTIGRISTDYLNGHLDELGVWNRTLSDDEIQSLYNRGKIFFNITG